MQYALLNYKFDSDGDSPFYGRVLIKLKSSKYHNPLKKHYWSGAFITKYLDKIITYKNVRIYQELNRYDFIIVPIDSDSNLIVKNDTIYGLAFSTDEDDKILEFDSDNDAKLWFEMKDF